MLPASALDISTASPGPSLISRPRCDAFMLPLVVTVRMRSSVPSSSSRGLTARRLVHAQDPMPSPGTSRTVASAWYAPSTSGSESSFTIIRPICSRKIANRSRSTQSAVENRKPVIARDFNVIAHPRGRGIPSGICG